jgi:hypothetical protein
MVGSRPISAGKMKSTGRPPFFVSKILKGANPARSSRQPGEPEMLARADEVIE